MPSSRPPDTAPGPQSDLRSRSLRGAFWLVWREGAGIVIRLLGILALTRLLGPADFGLYAGALVVVTVLATVAQLNSEVFLIRRERPPTQREVGTIYTLLVAASAAVIAVALAVTVALSAWGISAEYLGPFRVLLLGLLFNVLWAPAQAALERDLRYRALGTLEVVGDVVLYGIALPLALAGLGPYAPAWGYVGWQVFLLVGATVLSGVTPHFAFDRCSAKKVLRFGLLYSPVSFLARLSEVTNPVVVGAVLGPAAVGYVALAQRLVVTVGFVARTTYRVALVALARVQGDVVRLKQGFEEGVGLQALGVALPLALLSLAAPALLPLAFGEEWTPVLRVLPLLALAALVGDLLALNSHVLVVRGRESVVAVAYVTRFVLLLVSSALLLPVLGLSGYGYASLIAVLGLLPLHLGLRRIFPPSYARAVPWLVALGPVIAFPLVPEGLRMLLLLPVVGVLALPSPRHQIAGYAHEIKAVLKRSKTRA